MNARSALVLLAGVIPLALPQAARADGAPGSVLRWSDPIPIAETSVAAPPALVTLDGAVHVFWLHRPTGALPSEGELWHAILSPGGRVLAAPRRIARGADTRLAWPAAVRSGAHAMVAWMRRDADGVRLQVAVLDAGGTVLSIVSPVSAPAEEAGRIAVLDHGGAVHVAWSQFSQGRRRIWYARLSPDGRIDLPARGLSDGDAPALAGGETPLLLWWQSAGPGTDRLLLGEIVGGALGGIEELTGHVLLVSPLPPLPLLASEGLDVLVPTTERAFRTSGQLYLVRVRGPGVTARLPLSGGRPMGDVSAASGPGGGIVVWSRGAGRRQNSEIFAAAYDGAVGRLSADARVTYTPAGSLRPAVTAAAGGFVAAWLETLDIARFQVVFATSLGARSRRFLLGAPELDLRRPGQFIPFAATVLVSVLPYAALFTALFSIPALAVWLAMTAVLGGFTWWQDLQRRPSLRLGVFLGLVLALELALRSLIPGGPAATLVVGALLAPALLLFAYFGRRRPQGGMVMLLAAACVLFIQMTTVLFPWGVQQLTQF